MSLFCSEKIAEQVNNRAVLIVGPWPFTHRTIEGLPSTPLDIKASHQHKVKVVFLKATSYVVVDVQALQQLPPDTDSFYENPRIPVNDRIATALVASVIEGLKLDIFPGLKIGKIIEEIRLVEQGIIFTTLRLQTTKEGEEKYKILVLKRAGRTGKYEQDNMITLSVLRKNETIEIELGSQGASRNDTIEIRAILNAVLGKLGEQEYIIYDPEMCPGKPGKLTFDNFKPTD
jgi:hypothetical protein